MTDEFFPTSSIDPIKWNHSLHSLSTLAVSRPSFASLRLNYNLDKHGCPDVSPSVNECAVRLSRSLIAVGLDMDMEFPGKLCRHGYARGAQDLGAFLRIKWGSREFGFESPKSAPALIKGKTGVILFANIPDFSGQGHIDLWDGGMTMTGEYWNANPIWFWVL